MKHGIANRRRSSREKLTPKYGFAVFVHGLDEFIAVAVDGLLV